MDAISQLSHAMVRLYTTRGRPVAICVPKAAGDRLIASLPCLDMGKPARWNPGVLGQQIMGIQVIPPPPWWPENFVGMRDLSGRWHYVEIKERADG